MTTTSELFSRLRKIPDFKGVFPCDKLPNISKGYLIMNTQPSSMPGEHWVAMTINTTGEYFDSYGFYPLNKEAEEFMNERTSTWTYNRVTLQGLNNFTCGEYCVMYIYIKALGYSMFDYINLFTTNSEVNDKIVKKLYKDLFQ